MTGYNRTVGMHGEDEAALFFLSRGFEIVARNFRFGRHGEIDLIARKDGLLVFVEVKTRSSDRYGGALYSINRRKAGTIRAAALSFLSQNSNFNKPEFTCRFDLLAVEDGNLVWHQDVIR
ncbi:MAG TPA: YraN family protein [Spirochaetota bacterium]|nr:YraN family protein [Spirochaetota bacterium]HRZ27833.1 YraN family protein [Spirochaetota bacterium]HSA13630.1 YraN family protein [Spirochaetota bacterium]